jgi:CheY-like chemotaxis protein
MSLAQYMMDLLYGSGNGEEFKSMTDSHFPASKKTIMVVDDNQDLVEIVRTMLEEDGFNVRCAYSGQELFAGLEEQKPDLILLDIMMPKMDGYEVISRLKWKLGTSSIPVIFLTAKGLYGDVIRGYKTGCEYYITKPFTNSQLFTAINLLLGVPETPPSHPIASA